MSDKAEERRLTRQWHWKMRYCQSRGLSAANSEAWDSAGVSWEEYYQEIAPDRLTDPTCPEWVWKRAWCAQEGLDLAFAEQSEWRRVDAAWYRHSRPPVAVLTDAAIDELLCALDTRLSRIITNVGSPTSRSIVRDWLAKHRA